MKQNLRGMVSKLPVGIYEQFGGMPRGEKRRSPQTSSEQTPSNNHKQPKLSIVVPNIKISYDDINRIEQINLVRLADTIYELNQIDIENKINFIVSLIYDKISDEILDKIDNENEKQRKDLEYKILKQIEDNIINHKLDIKNLKIEDFVKKLNIEDFVKNLNIEDFVKKSDTDVDESDTDVDESDTDVDESDTDDTGSDIGSDTGSDTDYVDGSDTYDTDIENINNKNPSHEGGINDIKQVEPPYNKYEKSDYVHDFAQFRGNKRLHSLFKKSTYNDILESINGQVQTEDNIVDNLGLPTDEGPVQYNNNGKMYSTRITSLDAYEDIKHLPINEKIYVIFNNENTNGKFTDLINKCKEIYRLIKENKCDYLQFDQGDTKKLLLETPISPDSTIGLTRLRNLPTLIDGAGSSKIDTIIENKNNTNNTNAGYWTAIYNSIFHGQDTFSLVDYNRDENSSDVNGFKMNNETIKNGFTVDNLKEVMCHIDNSNNYQMVDANNNEILNLVKNIEGDDNKLQILRKLKFIGDRGQIVSAMKDNDENFTSRTLLGSGDRIFIAYALEQQEPIIFSNQGITRLYVPDILPTFVQLIIIEQDLLKLNTSGQYNNQENIKEYADAIFEAFLEKKFKEIQENITSPTIENITITNEEIKELIMSTFINFIDNQDIQFKLLKDEILNLDIKDVNSFSINNTDFSIINNERSMNDSKDKNINDIIQAIINKIKPGRPVKNLYKKIKDLLSTYTRKALNQRDTNKPSKEQEYVAYKIQLIYDKNIISEYEKNINEKLKDKIKDNIKSLFDFKEKATESIEKIKSYKDEVKNALGENASRIMNEKTLMEHIKKQENQ